MLLRETAGTDVLQNFELGFETSYLYLEITTRTEETDLAHPWTTARMLRMVRSAYVLSAYLRRWTRRQQFDQL